MCNSLANLTPSPFYKDSNSSMILRNTPLRLKRDGYMGQVVPIYIRQISNLISQIWYAWCHAMASWQLCRHRANRFVLVFRIVNTSSHCRLGGCWFGWCFSPFWTETHSWEQLRCSEVHTMCIHMWVCIYCVPGTQQQWCSFAAYSGASQPAGGSAICVDNTQKAVEWQAWLMQCLASSGDLLTVPSGGCML